MYITPKKFLLFFIPIIFLFLFNFFSIKKVNSAGESLVCPGLKMFKNWCAGEHIENNGKNTENIYKAPRTGPLHAYTFFCGRRDTFFAVNLVGTVWSSWCFTRPSAVIV